MVRRAALAAGLIAVICPAFAQTAPLSAVERTSLAQDAFSTGVIGKAQGALEPDMWRGSDPKTLETLLAMAPALPSAPAIGEALRLVLLSPGEGPAGAPASLGGAKLNALVRAGFIDEAREIEALAVGANTDPASRQAIAAADLLTADLDKACSKARSASAGLEDSFWIRLRILCYARSNELDAAELALGVLRENAGLVAGDDALLVALASGGAPKTPVAPADAIQLAALAVMKVTLAPGLLDRADGGVLVAIARNNGADWPLRLDSARRAAAAGVMDRVELKTLYGSAPADAAPVYRDIAAMAAPELLRDRLARIAAEISSAGSFYDFYATAVLFAEEIRAGEGAVVAPGEASALSLARTAIGDAVGAERWLVGAAPAIAAGAPDDATLAFIDAASALAILEPAAGARMAAAGNISLGGGSLAARSSDGSREALAPVVAAAIGGARRGAVGELALAGLAASSTEAGDELADAILNAAFDAAGMEGLRRRRDVERSLAAMFDGTVDAAPAAAVTPASDERLVPPRLKPKRSA